MLHTRKRRLERHVRKLCDEHDIRFKVKKGRGHARVKARSIQIPPIKEDMNYFVALHEVGHVVDGMPKGVGRLQREADAWTFALAHAIIDPDYRVKQRICALLVRYWFRAQKAGWTIPKDGPFWDHMQWW